MHLRLAIIHRIGNTSAIAQMGPERIVLLGTGARAAIRDESGGLTLGDEEVTVQLEPEMRVVVATLERQPDIKQPKRLRKATEWAILPQKKDRKHPAQKSNNNGAKERRRKPNNQTSLHKITDRRPHGKMMH